MMKTQLTEELARVRAAFNALLAERDTLKGQLAATLADRNQAIANSASFQLALAQSDSCRKDTQLAALRAELNTLRPAYADACAHLAAACGIAHAKPSEPKEQWIETRCADGVKRMVRAEPSEPSELDELYTANELIAKERDAVRQQLAQSEEVLLRLRQICESPYKAKHGRPLSTDRGWVWEMVQFIHHAVAP